MEARCGAYPLAEQATPSAATAMAIVPASVRGAPACQRNLGSLGVPKSTARHWQAALRWAAGASIKSCTTPTKCAEATGGSTATAVGNAEDAAAREGCD